MCRGFAVTYFRSGRRRLMGYMRSSQHNHTWTSASSRFLYVEIRNALLHLEYLDLELAPRGKYQTGAAFPTRIISGHTIPTRSALVSRLLKSGAMGAIAPLATAARPFIATSTQRQVSRRSRLQLQRMAGA